MKITLISFGARNGVPIEAMETIGCRGIQNPHHNRKLRYLTGLDQEVSQKVLKHPKADELIGRALELIYIRSKRGDEEFVLGFFCTAGHHRSVAIAEAVAEFLRFHKFEVNVQHRDIRR